MDDKDKIVINGNFGKFLRQYWFLLVFIGSVLIAWTNVKNSLNDNDKRIIRLEMQYENVSELRNDITEIKTSLKFIEGRFKEFVK